MLVFINAAIIVLLLVVTYQDLKFRAVHWLVFPMLALLVVLKYQTTGELGYSLRFFLLNLAFLSIQFLLLYIYLCIKNKSRINITENYLGWGDILFLLVSTLFFSPVNYLFFYLFSLILVLIIALFADWTPSRGRTVPLAGVQAMVLAIVYGIDLYFRQYGMLSDDFLLNLF